MFVKMLVAVAALALPGAALAQGTEWSPPPMVPATPPPTPPPEPGVAPSSPGTPAPPTATPPPNFVPGSGSTSGWQYSPYGQQKPAEKPGPEVGLMVSESLFGMLTAAGVAILPYFLFFKIEQSRLTAEQPTIASILCIIIFTAVPLAVSQTQVSIANGSRHYFSDTWPVALTGLVGQAGVLGLFYLTGWLPTPTVTGGTPSTGGSEVLLFVGTIVVVPLLQMMAINLFKSEKMTARPFGALDAKPGHGVRLAAPSVAPTIAPTRAGTAYGLNFSLLSGTW